MQIKQISRAAALIGLAAGLSLSTGCSRSAINYQIAESIGTVGMYENNEPVETPKMEQERLQREAAEEKEAQIQTWLADAEVLAKGYWYDEAIASLESITGENASDPRIAEAISSYQQAKDSLVSYEGDIPHLCFPGLIEDTMRAFDGDDMSYSYAGSMVTTKEFRSILESLYENGYVLVDIHNIARDETDARGVTTMEMQELLLPPDKKPIIISQDNLNYSGIRNGDGIATRLVLDDDEKVKALYTDEGGHDLKGNYDLVPILDAFVEEHPDFSWCGAKGIVSVSGSEGVFGYQVADTTVTSYEENRKIVKQILDQLKKSGWSIACAGYSHTYLDGLDLSGLQSEIGKWLTEVGNLTGKVDILFYPYGAEVGYPSEQLDYLLENEFQYFCGLWGDTDYMDLKENYMRQTRRFVDGYTLENAPQYFVGFFNANDVLDEDR